MKYKYFDLKEFSSPDEPGSGKHMQHEFLKMLDSCLGLHTLTIQYVF